MYTHYGYYVENGVRKLAWLSDFRDHDIRENIHESLTHGIFVRRIPPHLVSADCKKLFRELSDLIAN